MKRIFICLILFLVLTFACGHATGPGLTSPSIDFYCPGTDKMYNQIFGGFPDPPQYCLANCHWNLGYY